MHKGRGELTYKQLQDENRKLREENKRLQNDLKSRMIAPNKLMKEKNL